MARGFSHGWPCHRASFGSRTTLSPAGGTDSGSLFVCSEAPESVCRQCSRGASGRVRHLVKEERWHLNSLIQWVGAFPYARAIKKTWAWLQHSASDWQSSL